MFGAYKLWQFLPMQIASMQYRNQTMSIVLHPEIRSFQSMEYSEEIMNIPALLANSLSRLSICFFQMLDCMLHQ